MKYVKFKIIMKNKYSKKNKKSIQKFHSIYGINGSIQVLKSKKFEIARIDIMSDGNAFRKSEIKSILTRFKGRVHTLPKEVFLKNYSGKRTQGIVVHFKGEIYQNIPSFKNSKLDCCLLILDNIEDPQNLGQIIRTAEGGGVNGIVIPEHKSTGLTNSTLQVSQGAFVHLPVYRCKNLRHQIKELKSDGFWIYALENSIDAKLWYEIDLRGKVAIVLGSEGRGIRKLVLKECDGYATIPMKGKINSLNVSAATSAIVFEILRQKTCNQ